MRPVTGGHPAIEFPPGAIRVPTLSAAQLRRRGLLLRFVAAVLAVMLLLLVWRPAVVRAQGRPAVLPASAPVGVTPPSSPARAGARATPDPRAAGTELPGTSGTRAAPVVIERPEATGIEGAEQVPFGGALVVEAYRSGTADSTRLDLRPQGGRELVPRSARAVGLVGADDWSAARAPDEAFTVFHRERPDPVESARRTRDLLAHSPAAPRFAEHQAAPFPVAVARLARGAIVGAAAVASADREGGAHRYRIDDEVPLRFSRDAEVRVGDVLTPVVAAGTLGGPLRVAVPTGVVEVVRVGRGTARAVVRSQFAVIAEGQRLLPVTRDPAPWTSDGGPRTLALDARVRWVEAAGRLLAPQTYVLLDVGASHGVRSGDRFALHRRSALGRGEGEAVALARVVRVDGAYSAVRIIDIREAELSPDRLVARRLPRTEDSVPRTAVP